MKYNQILMISEILAYCSSKNLERKKIYRVQSVFEELCENILHDRLSENGQICVLLEYSENTESITMNIKHTVDGFCLNGSDNDLALKLIRHNTLSIDETEKNSIILKCFSMTGRHFPIFGMVKLLTTPE